MDFFWDVVRVVPYVVVVGGVLGLAVDFLVYVTRGTFHGIRVKG